MATGNLGGKTKIHEENQFWLLTSGLYRVTVDSVVNKTTSESCSHIQATPDSASNMI